MAPKTKVNIDKFDFIFGYKISFICFLLGNSKQLKLSASFDLYFAISCYKIYTKPNPC